METKKKKYILQGAVPKDKSEKTCLEKYGNKYFFASDAGNMNSENLKKTYGYTDEEIDNLKELKKTASYDAFEKRNGGTEEEYKEYCKRYDSSSYTWATKKTNNPSEADSLYKERIKNRSVVFGRASKSSLKVFLPIIKFLQEEYSIREEDFFIGYENKNEYFIWDDNCKRIYFYDLVIMSKKIIIEFNGSFYHPKTKEEDEVKWERDRRKIDVAKENGFVVMIVWDDISVNNNIQYIKEEIKKCLKM